VLTRIERTTLVVQAADKLRQHFVAGTLKPGTRVTEAALAADLGLSRGTIRGALDRLAHEGLVVQVPYTGWEVAALSGQDIWELYTLRGTLEALAGRLAASARDGGSTIELDAAYDELVAVCEAGDPEAVARADFYFHKAIVAMSGHRRLAQQYTVMELQIQMFVASSDALVGDQREVGRQHAPIVEAIRVRDADLAERLCREHNSSEGEVLRAHKESQAPVPRRSAGMAPGQGHDQPSLGRST
jgi:DNA-binding GntR family transcriptional regulator